jgi:serine/threonine protein kinase
MGNFRPCVFIDMELCDFNLHSYIKAQLNPESKKETPASIFFPPNRSVRMKQAEIWHIMEDITRRLIYIEDMDEVHRDLKPANGTSYWIRLTD